MAGARARNLTGEMEGTKMRSLTTAGNRPLEWASLKKRRFELRCDSDVCAALAWQTMFGSLAVGEAGGNKWSFKRMGFFRTVITVREPDSETDLAVLRSTRRGQALLTFTDGSTFTWKSTGEARREKGFYDDRERLLTAVRLNQKFLSISGEARILPHATNLTKLPILALLAWYRVYLEHEEETAVVMGAIASIG
jgi:hypothetical protein